MEEVVSESPVSSTCRMEYMDPRLPKSGNYRWARHLLRIFSIFALGYRFYLQK